VKYGNTVNRAEENFMLSLRFHTFTTLIHSRYIHEYFVFSSDLIASTQKKKNLGFMGFSNYLRVDPYASAMQAPIARS